MAATSKKLTHVKKPSSWSVCTTERLCLLFLNTVIAHDTCIYFSSLTHTGAAALLVWQRNLWAPALIRVMPHTSRLWLGCQCDKSVRKAKMTGWERPHSKERVSPQQHWNNNPGSFHPPWTVRQCQGVETSGASVKRQSSLQRYLLWYTLPGFQQCMA